MPTTFVDQSGATPGTALSAANLNGLVSGLTTSNLSATAGIVGGQIASVNGAALVAGVRQLKTFSLGSDQTLDAGYQNPNVLDQAHWAPALGTVALTTTAGSSLLVAIFGNPNCASAGWVRLGAALDSGTVQTIGWEAASTNADMDTLGGLTVFAGVSAASHTVKLVYQASANIAFKCGTSGGTNVLCMAVVEFA